MMDEVWSRRWMEAHDAALQARKQQVEAARLGGSAPSLWGDLRALARDLIHPPAQQQVNEICDPKTCQSAA